MCVNCLWLWSDPGAWLYLVYGRCVSAACDYEVNLELDNIKCMVDVCQLFVTMKWTYSLTIFGVWWMCVSCLWLDLELDNIWCMVDVCQLLVTRPGAWQYLVYGGCVSAACDTDNRVIICSWAQLGGQQLPLTHQMSHLLPTNLK